MGEQGLAAAYPEDLRDAVEQYLGDLRFGDRSETAGLEEAMRYSLLAGGKRIRPVLALATAEALGRKPSDAMPYGAALELVHTYSLIHDDLPAMDDDDLRRGRPTCHVAYGENIAILAGDALFAEALLLITTRQQGDPAAVLAGTHALLSAIGAGGMVGGQFIDIEQGALDPDGLRLLHQLKTGRLIEASVTGAALVLGAPDRLSTELSGFASELGVLFQIIDDILDVTGTDAELGKPSGSDQRHGKVTYVSMFGLEQARELAKQSYNKARSALEAADLPGDRSSLAKLNHFIYGRNS